ncbi:transcriptional regulator [Demequina sp.]|uniref:transcriptional regulator n=1 Tax=Demequina sp. TaxID=2050685 RepID=UPI0025C19D2E|nr:transcriptional regulator [Demequina sp.]
MDELSTGEGLLAETLKFLGVGFEFTEGNDTGADLTIITDTGTYPVKVKRWASFPDSATERNPDLRIAPSPPLVRVVVADRVSASARARLTELEWAWLDLRGHLRLRAPGLVIDSDVPPLRSRPERVDAIGGRAGLEVACAILEEPRSSHTVRELARTTKRAPSTVSEVVKAMRLEGLISAEGFDADAELFWRVAGRWNLRRTYLARLPQAGRSPDALELGFGGDVTDGPGWAMTGDHAAAADGAPVGVRADARVDFYVPSRAAARRAVAILGQASDRAAAACAVIVPPVPRACVNRRELDLDWPVARGLYVALDLATDAGRGREVLDSWSPPYRVW